MNWIVSLAVLAISAFTYLSTIEPTASFWDCGEFIASSYKLEVGHPPGNPVFQLFARFFTIPVDAAHAAVAVNAMNAILSALTIFLLYYLRLRGCRCVGVLLLGYLLVQRRGGRGLCDVVPFHRPRFLGDVQVVRPGR